MQRKFLADSYDAVKRLWNDLLSEWLPLYANPRFVPEDLWEDYTRFTGIRVRPHDDQTHSPYLLLNDPDTGIRLPSQGNQQESRRHVNLETITAQLREPSVRGVITFDQSHYRYLGIGKKGERDQKREWLTDRGLFCFYFDSHAPFLFAFQSETDFQEAQKLLSDAGIPEFRIED